MNKGGICNLSAEAHVQGVYTLQMNKGSISDGDLIAVAHVQGV